MMAIQRRSTARPRRFAASALLSLAALSSTISPVAVLALDADCQLPDSPPYTGYSLKVGTACEQYVYCRDGIVSDWLTCTGGLLFSGSVGMGGVCMWADQVACPPDGDFSVDGAAAADAMMVLNNAAVILGLPPAAPNPTRFPTKSPTPEPTDRPTPVPTDDPSAEPTVANPNYYFCGASIGNAAELCIPCASGYMNDCGDDSMGCFRNVVACAADGTAAEEEAPPPANPQNYYCGTSLGEAGELCEACPSGYNYECSNDAHGCFPGVDGCDPDAVAGEEENPNNYYCGPSMMEAATLCEACPSGYMSECSNEGHGCFPNVEVCDPNYVPPQEPEGDSQEDSNPNDYYCGSSLDQAATTCEACPSGYMRDCSQQGHGCFPGVSSCAPTEAPAPNPANYFCGDNLVNAAEICKPCATGYMQDCEDETHGCFMGVDACSPPEPSAAEDAVAQAILDSFYNMMNDQGQAQDMGQQQQQQQPDQMSNMMSQQMQPQQAQQSQPQNQQAQQQQQQQQMQAMQADAATPTSAATVPNIPPSLPPYSNAPFVPSPQLSASKTVIGYYASWQWYDRDKFADPINVDFSKYDRINYAFFQPDVDGNLFGTDAWGDPQLLWGPYERDASKQRTWNWKCSWDGPDQRNCDYHQLDKGLLSLAQGKGVKVMPSIGGWTLSDNFPGVAASAWKRNRFAEQCVELIEEYGFDGIDIDWEYPGFEDHSGTPADTENFTLLLQAIRDKLSEYGETKGRAYPLTAALPCGTDKIEKIQVQNIRGILDELNLMTYDMHGAWDALTGTNAPMYDQGWGDPAKRWSVHGCVNNYVEQGVHLSKINIGLPFYGRAVQAATGMKQFHGGVDDIKFHLDEGSPQYFNIVNELATMKTFRHEATQTQYAVGNQGGGLVSYDDPRAICDKVEYANERGLNGFIIWEISGDMIQREDGSMYTPLINTIKNKVENPNFDCSSIRDPNWALSSADVAVYRYAPDEPESVDWSQYDGPANTGSGNDFDGAQNANFVSWNNADGSIFVPDGDAGDSNQSKDCPPDYTGYFAAENCEKYVFCQDGAVLGASLPCVPGTLFDVTIGVCNHAAQVLNCGGESSR